jgi:hypothetical protein
LIAAEKDSGKRVFGDHYTMFGHDVVAHVLASAVSFQIDPYAAEKPTFKQCVAPDADAGWERRAHSSAEAGINLLSKD